MSRVRLTPETFTLVPDYDAAAIVAIAEEEAAVAGVPDDVVVELTVDEELFAPLVGSSSDVVDGRVVCWISGGNLEDTRRPRHFDAAAARLEIAALLLRAGDRLRPGFAAAPPDEELTDAQRSAWDAWTVGRLARRGLPVRRPKALYDYRLQHGFSDVVDATFERLWSTDELTWADIDAVGRQTGAADRPKPKDAARRGIRPPAATR